MLNMVEVVWLSLVGSLLLLLFLANFPNNIITTNNHTNNSNNKSKANNNTKEAENKNSLAGKKRRIISNTSVRSRSRDKGSPARVNILTLSPNTAMELESDPELLQGKNDRFGGDGRKDLDCNHCQQMQKRLSALSTELSGRAEDYAQVTVDYSTARADIASLKAQLSASTQELSATRAELLAATRKCEAETDKLAETRLELEQTELLLQDQRRVISAALARVLPTSQRPAFCQDHVTILTGYMERAAEFANTSKLIYRDGKILH